MQIIYDAQEKSAVAVYPEDITSMTLFDFGDLVSDRDICLEIISLLRNSFRCLKIYIAYGTDKCKYHFWRFNECIIVCVSAELNYNLLVSEAVMLKTQADKLRKYNIKCFFAVEIELIYSFVLITKHKINRLYKYNDRYYFTSNEKISKETVNEFLIQPTKIDEVVLAEHGDLLIKENASGVLKKYF